jgi:hypothetical protein
LFNFTTFTPDFLESIIFYPLFKRSVKFYTKNLIKNHENNYQEKKNHLSNKILKNVQKFVDIIVLLIPTDMKTIFQHKNQTVKLRLPCAPDILDTFLFLRGDLLSKVLYELLFWGNRECKKPNL